MTWKNRMANVSWRLLLLTVVLVVITAVVGAAAVQVRQKRQELAQAPKFGVDPVPVHVVAARAGTLSESRSYLAVVEPLQTAEVSARLTAEVLSISCDEGDVVQAGDAMAVLDSREIRAGIAAAEAQISQAREDLQASQVLMETLTASVDYWRRQLTRDQSLRENNAAAISMAEVEGTAEKLQLKQGELDAARYRLNAIQHGVAVAEEKKRELETRLAYCNVVSPFDGVVTKRLVDAGDLAVPGKGLFRIEDRSTVRLTFDIPQDDLADIRPGFDVTFSAAGETRRAALTRVYPSLNAVRMVRAEVDLPAPAADGLIPGSYLSLDVILRVVQDAAIVPVSALTGTGDGPPQVYVVQQDQLALLPVEVLVSRQNEMAVSGISVGAEVVVHPFLGWARYHDGQKVEVLR